MLKKYAKRIFLIILVSAFLIAGVTEIQARLVYLATAGDGSFCAAHYDNSTGVHDYDVCWAASTGEYTFFDVR
jgi:hypothetical protein